MTATCQRSSQKTCTQTCHIFQNVKINRSKVKMREVPSLLGGSGGCPHGIIFLQLQVQVQACKMVQSGDFLFRPLFFNSSDFSMTFIKTSEFQDFSRPGIFHFKFQDFSRIPGLVGTLIHYMYSPTPSSLALVNKVTINLLPKICLDCYYMLSLGWGNVT